MTNLFTRMRRLIERLDDGDAIDATELARVAPLYATSPASEVEGFAQQLLSLTRTPVSQLLGDVVLGEDLDPAMTLPCSPRRCQDVLAQISIVVAYLGFALEHFSESELVDLQTALGLEPHHWSQVARTRVTRSLKKFVDPVPVMTAKPWILVIVSSIPVVDVVSPYVRDVAGSLHAFAQLQGIELHDDDQRYAVLDTLFAYDSRLETERDKANESCGIFRSSGDYTLVDPRALDLGSVDVRVRNALHGLRRKGGSVVVAEAKQESVESLLWHATSSPTEVYLLTRAICRGCDVASVVSVRHAEGHRICVAEQGAQHLLSGLPRHLKIADRASVLSIPASRFLRADVVGALHKNDVCIDTEAYAALLALQNHMLEKGPCNTTSTLAALEVTCIAASETCCGAVAAAFWRCIGEIPRVASLRSKRPATR